MSIVMPVGCDRQVEARARCGLVSEHKTIGMFDDPRSLFEPEHVHAPLLWFAEGYVETAFAHNLP